MNGRFELYVLTHETRARVYLLWAVLTSIGYISTHYYQRPNINAVWFALSVVGLGYMFRVMPLKVIQMKRIFQSWFIPISLGLAFSVLAVRTDLIPEAIGYLGIFWMFVSSAGYALNGTVDPPSKWYFVAAAAHLAAGAACLLFDSLFEYQYLVAAVVSAWSLLCLWLFRSDA